MNAVPGDALGRATLCALMSSNGMQEEQIFQLTFKSDGPVRGCVAIVNGKGEARKSAFVLFHHVNPSVHMKSPCYCCFI